MRKIVIEEMSDGWHISDGEDDIHIVLEKYKANIFFPDGSMLFTDKSVAIVEALNYLKV